MYVVKWMDFDFVMFILWVNCPKRLSSPKIGDHEKSDRLNTKLTILTNDYNL